MTSTCTNRESAAEVAPEDGAELRILIENGEYWLSNKGDLAMLEVAVSRLRNRWPRARIAVLTYVPALLRAYLPYVEAVTPDDTDPWSTHRLMDRVGSKVGPQVVGPLAYSRTLAKARRARSKLMTKMRRIVGAGGTDSLGQTSTAAEADTALPVGMVKAIQEATLVIALGGGYLTDVDPGQAHRLLSVVATACSAGKPVALLGQGIGPINDAAMTARAAQVLPTANLIALRERRRGPRLLAELGVAEANVEVTGDDAIELPYSIGATKIGDDIGVCLRVAYYSPLSADRQQRVGKVLRSSAAHHEAALSPIFIAEYESEDRRSTLPLVQGYPHVTKPVGAFAGPRAVAAHVSGCRVVVTGAYHLGVFALAQGIPIVALTTSEYYDDKFNGLADMFGCGLQLVHLDDDNLEERLASAIDTMWAQAPQVREPLREAARRQIATSRAAFERTYQLLQAPTPRP